MDENMTIKVKIRRLNSIKKIYSIMAVLILIGTILLAGCTVNTSIQEKNEAMGWYNKGLALVKQEKYSEALECHDKAISINPNSALAWNDKGIILEALGRNTEAQECFNKAEALGYKE